ncbi:MAG: hypothetical protein IH613_02020 [Desulfuromonadales bacterium]|nr:hypothetical protein [Desulfuromonadales bacterium]
MDNGLISRKLWKNLVLLGMLLAGCSSTTLSGSWKDPDYTGQIKKVYIVGMAKQETTRRILEDAFQYQLSAYGVSGLSSYKDLPNIQNADETKIAANIKTNIADSVLITHVTGKRTEEVVTPGRFTSYYDPWPYYGHPYYDWPFYNNYGSYYNYRRQMIYEPTIISQYKVITAEANLYDTRSNKLIWSAQLETVIENDIQKLVNDFVKTVIKDMNSKGLI